MTISQKSHSENCLTVGSNNNWETQKHSYTEDDLIDAYNKGKMHIINEGEKVLSAEFQNNLIQAQGASERVFLELMRNNINLKGIRLRISNINHFDILFLATEKDFLSENFSKAFSVAREAKRKTLSNSKIYLTFAFTPYSNHFNEKCVIADGFLLKYDTERHREA